MANEERGKFICIEGPDGVGKTRQAARLYAYLKDDLNMPVVPIQEPGGTDLGRGIRSILLSSGISGHLTPASEALLFYAARTQLLTERVAPALDRGDHVVADRFEESSWVYQGVVRGLGSETIALLSQAMTMRLGCIPDLYINLDAPVEIALARLNGRVDESTHFDRETTEFHEKVRASYKEFLKLSAEGVLPFAPKVVEVDASKVFWLVQQNIRDLVDELLGVNVNG